MTFDELRAIAEAATPGPWTWNEGYLSMESPDGLTFEDESYSDTVSIHNDARFIATFDPDRILAMLDALRATEQIVAGEEAIKALAAFLARLEDM